MYISKHARIYQSATQIYTCTYLYIHIYITVLYNSGAVLKLIYTYICIHTYKCITGVYDREGVARLMATPQVRSHVPQPTIKKDMVLPASRCG